MSQHGQPRGGTPRGGGGSGHGRGQHQHRGGDHRGGRGKPRNNEPEPASRSKKEIEASQQALLQKQRQEKNDRIAAAEAMKKNAPVPLEHSFTYIPGTLSDLQKLPDLDAHWSKGYPSFMLYLPQDNAHNSDGSFIPNSRADELFDIWNTDLDELLRDKYNVFWSRIIFDESISRFLDSYLRFFLRPIMWDDSYPQNNSVARSVYERVFKVLYRCSQAKEDEHLFMKTQYWADLILEKNVFDIPKLLDICVLYSDTIPQQVEQMLDRIFAAQPKYTERLVESLSVTSQALAKVEEQLKSEGLRPKELHDLQMYVLDIATTLDAAAEVLPSSALASATVSADFLPAWIRFCSAAIQRLQDSRLAQKMSVSLLPNIRSAAASFVDSFLRRCFSQLTHASLQELLALIKLLCSSAPTVAKDIQHHHNLMSWLAGVSRGHPPLQPAVDAFARVTGATIPAPVGKAPTVTAASATAAQHPKQPPEAQLQSLISHVRDMFPDLGDGFVERALAEFDFSAERTVDALLENNLSPALAALDKKTSRATLTKSPAPASSAGPTVSVVPAATSAPSAAQRRNVFSGDEYDIFANDTISADKFHIGKRELKMSQDDREELKKFITTYATEYEDEPDDSLDAFEKLGVADASVDEAVNVLKRNPNRRIAVADDDDDEDEAATAADGSAVQDGQNQEDEEDDEAGDGAPLTSAGRGVPRGGRGGGGRGGRGGNYNRKDRSAKKRGHLFRP